MNHQNKKILQIRNLKIHYLIKKPFISWYTTPLIKAVDDVSFDLYEGETLGIAGESGCGKSSLAKALVGLNQVTQGEILWKENNLAKANKKLWRKVRQELQIIFQDPIASLNPRMTIGQCIAEPLDNFCPELTKQQKHYRTQDIIDKVGLTTAVIHRYPHELSGGQCQRVGIARALIIKPRILICDEAVSALDVSIQAQVVNLLQDLQKEMNLSLLFISHDLSVVKHISNRVLVMYLGKPMELADAEALYKHPMHPYTDSLLSAIPSPYPNKEKNKTPQPLEGELPSPNHPPTGCVFHTRCPHADEGCKTHLPALEQIHGHTVSCLKVNT